MFARKWRILVTAATLVVGFQTVTLTAQEKPVAAPKKIAIRAGRLIDGKSDKPVQNALILIEGDTIVSVSPGAIRLPAWK